MIDLNILCAGRFCFYKYMATRIPFIKTYSTPQELVQLLKTRGMKKAYRHQIILKGNDTYYAYYPFSRLSSKKLINSSEILEISPLS